jgi:hypothetical protein
MPPEIRGPLSPIRLVNAKLLTLDELAFAIEGEEAARRSLADSFAHPRLASSLVRPSPIAQ